MGRDSADAESLEEVPRDGFLRIDGRAQQEKDDCGLKDACAQSLLDVAPFEVADLMGEHGKQLVTTALFNQCVKECDLFVFSLKTDKVKPQTSKNGQGKEVR